MGRLRWQIGLGAGLVAASAALYGLHFLIFHDAHHIFIYGLSELAFMPLEVLLVTLILHQLLDRRDKRAMLYKLNMVIGAFFSEVGTELMGRLATFDAEFETIRQNLVIGADWTDKRFAAAKSHLVAYEYAIDPRRSDLVALRELLIGKRLFLLALLENPNLLEHEAFTELLWAVFHLTEELDKRGDVSDPPAPDLEHVAADIRRAYALLIGEWFDYMKHLKNSYPFLFSFALRSNPLDPAASVTIRE